jgi:hypothetical protein
MGDALDDLLDSYERRPWLDEEPEEEHQVTRFMKREEGAGYEVGRVRVEQITERAIRVTYMDGPHVDDTDTWIPKSQIHSTSEVNDTTLLDEEGTLVISAWLAGKRGWVK